MYKYLILNIFKHQRSFLGNKYTSVWKLKVNVIHTMVGWILADCEILCGWRFSVIRVMTNLRAASQAAGLVSVCWWRLKWCDVSGLTCGVFGISDKINTFTVKCATSNECSQMNVVKYKFQYMPLKSSGLEVLSRKKLKKKMVKFNYLTIVLRHSNWANELTIWDVHFISDKNIRYSKIDHSE